MYLSHDVQNKVVDLAAKFIMQSFSKKVHKAKDLVVIIDTTREDWTALSCTALHNC